MAQAITGLRVGDAAPPFVLQTGDGYAVQLMDILSSRAAILVFIRGTW